MIHRPLVSALALSLLFVGVATAQDKPLPYEARGIVRVANDGQVYLDPHKSMSFRVTSDAAGTLRAFAGYRAHVQGRITRTGKFSSDIAVTRIVSPVRVRDLSVRTDNLTYSYVREKKIESFGPARKAMKVLGYGETVQVDGWLFEDEDHAPAALYVEAVSVRVTQPTALTGEDRALLASVPEGARVKVLNLASGIQRVRVQVGDRIGYVPTSAVDAAASAPPCPSATAGLTGRVASR